MHNKTDIQLIEMFGTNLETGLTTSQVKENLKKYGPNQITPQKQQSLWIKFFLQFNSPIVYILVIASGLSIVLKEYTDSIVIGVILVLNAVLWFVQEYKADQSLKKLTTMNVDMVNVIRNGKLLQLESKNIVPGDIVKFDAGFKVTADIRVLESFELKVDESTLTGESEASVKNNQIIIDERIGIADTDNMLFAGTYIVNGTGKGIVVKTGMDTELGKITHIVSASKNTITPLEKKLKKLGMQIALIVVIIAIIIIAIGIYEWHTLFEMFFVATSLAVSAIPEGLPAVVTLTLAIWVQKMYKQHVLVKQLKSIETLGSTTVICSDKTGTITQNKMTVTNIFINNKKFLISNEWDENFKQQKNYLELLKCFVHCGNAQLPKIGDPTEIALLQFASDYKISSTLVKIGEIPFDSEKKYMVTHHTGVSYIKGALENMLMLCSKINIDWNIIWLSEEDKEKILKQNNEYSREAIRVLGCGYNTDGANDFIFLGMVGMIDPPRDGVAEAIKECRGAGIRVIMITGDNINTAKAIAEKIGLGGNAMTWEEFDQCEDKVLAVKQTNIFARVSPFHKVQICELLQWLWEVVAMTGDGVNDAAAIKKADVGISMAITGTDVSKEAADMLLLDDNFVSIVKGVRSGRIIYTNMKKFVQFLMRVNFDEIILIVMCIVLKLPIPMIAIQVLWINLVTDSLPAVALGFDEGDEDIMRQKPRSKDEDIMKGSWWAIIFTTLICASSLILIYFYELEHNSLENMRTVIVTTIIFTELLLVYSIRSGKKSFRKIPSNPYLNGAVAISIILHVIALSTSLGSYFEFTRLDSRDWMRVAIVSLGVFTIFESYKFLRHKK